ncbi:MAG: AraC family transcriptional regulator [Candidatus Omnitrophota bacterium]|nr:AraC family transcriptional regulator [Candidatus Omnitrophota bacterium]
MEDIKKIQKLIGRITKQQLRYVDCYCSDDVGIFIPSVGPCFFAKTPLHKHPSYLFILAFDDNCSLKIKGKIITPVYGKICAISAGVLHHEIMEADFSRYIAIFISQSFFEKQLKGYTDKNELYFLGELFITPTDLISCIKDFMVEFENKMPGYTRLLQALSLKITHILIRSVLDVKPAIEKGSFRMKINAAIDYIYANYSNKIMVKDMAYNVAMSESHFARLFKEETGKSPNEYLGFIRLTQSQKLLRAGDKSLSCIADECGFSSSAYFSTCFYQCFGISPSKYRENFKIKQDC